MRIMSTGRENSLVKSIVALKVLQLNIVLVEGVADRLPLVVSGYPWLFPVMPEREY